MANISQCISSSSSRQNGLASSWQYVFATAAFQSFAHLLPLPLPFCASIAFVGIWRRFIDCVVFGRTIFVYIFPPARLPGCQAAWTESTRFDSLCVVLCVVFGTFSTKHFTLFIFATIALRFQVAFEVFVLSVGAQFHQCCPCLLPAASACCLCIHISHVYLWH